MLKTERETIDGVTVEVTTLTASKALKTWQKLVKILGPSMLRSLAGALPEEGEVKGISLNNLDLAEVAAGLQSMLDRLGENDQEDLTRVLFETGFLEKEGKRLPFLNAWELEYSGNLVNFYKALGFAIKVNFGNFLDALPAPARRVVA